MTFTNLKKPRSLECYFRKQSIRWALIGLLLTSFFSVPCTIYSIKVSSERQALYAVKSVVRAFRDEILQDDIRNTQLQMRGALSLQDDESVSLFDPNLNPIYPMSESDKTPVCPEPNRFCWSKGFQKVTILYPIYFRDQTQEGLFGYLQLTIKPTLDTKLIAVAVILILITFIIQAFGLTSALTQTSQLIVEHLSSWANHLKSISGKRKVILDQVPFSELKSMQEAVGGLYDEIEKLRLKVARETKTRAQISILREIGHDLKTPHSALAKYLAVHLETVRTTGHVNNEEVLRIERTLKRMGDFLRQIKVFTFGRKNPKHEKITESCDLNTELKFALEDFQSDPNIMVKKISVHTQIENEVMIAQISRTAFYRIAENLLKNAGEASPDTGGIITVSLLRSSNSFDFSVADNGFGIDPNNLDRIFDCDFTTKNSRGTGLGLAIVDNICNEFGSKVDVISTVNVGTRFKVTFPFNTTNKQAQKKGRKDLPNGQV